MSYRFQPKQDKEFPSAFQAKPRRQDTFQSPETANSDNQTAFPSAFGARDRRDRAYDSSSRTTGEYSAWKKQEEKKKPLTADDFPPLGGANPICMPKSESKGPSLAERLKVTIAKEEEEATMRRFRKEDEPVDRYEPVASLQLGKVLHGRHQKKKEQEEQRQAEWEQDEKNYDWQVSRDIVQESEEPYPPYACTTDDEYEDTSCFPADDEDDTVRPTTPPYH